MVEPSIKYMIEATGDGTFDVTRNRRAFAYDCEDLDDAMQRIRKRDGRGLVVTIVDQVGNRSTQKT